MHPCLNNECVRVFGVLDFNSRSMPRFSRAASMVSSTIAKALIRSDRSRRTPYRSADTDHRTDLIHVRYRHPGIAELPCPAGFCRPFRGRSDKTKVVAPEAAHQVADDERPEDVYVDAK
jgi:hypothetical protein